MLPPPGASHTREYGRGPAGSSRSTGVRLPMARQMETVQFNKDVALAGAALAFFWVFSQDVGLTLTGPLF